MDMLNSELLMPKFTGFNSSRFGSDQDQSIVRSFNRFDMLGSKRHVNANLVRTFATKNNTEPFKPEFKVVDQVKVPVMPCTPNSRKDKHNFEFDFSQKAVFENEKLQGHSYLNLSEEAKKSGLGS